MGKLSQAARNSVSLQAEMFRLAEQEHGLSVPMLARTRGIPKTTLEGWASGTVQMPAWAIGALNLPDDLASLILHPFRKHIGTDEEGEDDLDALADDAIGYAHEHLTARSPSSPGGVRIVHSEEALLRARARRMCPKARRIAA